MPLVDCHYMDFFIEYLYEEWQVFKHSCTHLGKDLSPLGQWRQLKVTESSEAAGDW